MTTGMIKADNQADNIARQNCSAPGGPGITPRWTSSAKTGVGAALGNDSHVWFTLSHGIKFAITSGRPPRGMSMLIRTLKITTPISAFNGGLFVRPDLTIMDQKVLPAVVAGKVIPAIQAHHLDVWVYRGKDWFVLKKNGPPCMSRSTIFAPMRPSPIIPMSIIKLLIFKCPL